MLAQSFAEYGSVTSIIAVVERAVYAATDFVRATGSGTWLVMGAVAIVLLLMLRR
jgi:hypothetical protein